ncbi:MAG TPA: electron transfer flavoprotein subunit beta/FixA family protein [Syntrophomonadaceae bacterium]|nr:electron transfer flavoprotein subunit beta/FixA family protein [Syntrophomonadaceae bacterium]HQA08110.1 electron transfer flavoprotein subunit beta/FixA family protein [Syntrophomonadaceae bacterium]HQE23480.1 electron transfer flavoprotein subunit beta/FixA family protein [Syntrophomonadaceae bacterium]
MNIVVAMKQIPDLQQIRISNRRPVLEDVPLTFGSIDKSALEAAVVLRDSSGEGEVLVLSAGNEDLEDTIKEALATGGNQAYLIMDQSLAGADSSIIAQVLAAGIKQLNDVDLILFGEGSGDNYSGQVSSRVARLLDLPQVGYARDIKIDGDTAQVVRVLEDCEEVVEVKLPAVITVLSDISEPRIPSVTQILKAGKKPKHLLELDELDISLDQSHPIITLSNLAPESNRKRIVVKNSTELIEVLKSENLIGG